MIIKQIDQLMLLRDELRNAFSGGVERASPDREYDTDILLSLSGIFSENKPDRATFLQEKYQECYALADSPTVESIELCVSRMVGLAQVFDYPEANLWLGEFSEIILEKNVEAGYWFRRAAALGNGIGMYRYGLLLLDRKIEKPSATSIKRCFTDAFEKGIDDAKSVLDNRAEEIEAAEKGEIIPSNTLLKRMCEGGHKEGYLYKFDAAPPEKGLDEMSRYIGVDLMDIFYTEDNLDKMGEVMLFSGVLCECFFAGYGAMSLWMEGKQLSKEECLDALCEPYGAERMDEYVMDRFDPKTGTEAGKRLCAHVIQMGKMVQTVMYSFDDNDMFNEQFVHGATALFNYGTLVRQQRTTPIAAG